MIFILTPPLGMIMIIILTGPRPRFLQAQFSGAVFL
jgi:hypothetical protein